MKKTYTKPTVCKKANLASVAANEVSIKPCDK